MTAPEILDTASPFWMRLYGKWIHLQGIMPVAQQTSQRAFSELVTVDGYRYVQRAPRGPRTWQVEYRYGTGAATAALESAAYDLNFNDPTTRTLWLDTDQAKVNMVDPDLLTFWQTSGFEPAFIINVGEPDGLPIWLPSYGVATPLEIPIRAGVTYTAAFWHTYPIAGTKALTITVDGVEVASSTTVGGGTEANPEQAVASFTAATDGTAVVTIHAAVQPRAAGMMFYEGDCPPTKYRVGRRMPCAVAVQDPSMTHNIVWSARCDPCDLPREHTQWTILEVGTGRAVPENTVPVSNGSA